MRTHFTYKTFIKEIRKSQILRVHFKELQKEMGVHLVGLKFVLFGSLLKLKNVLKHLAINEDMNLGKCLRSSNMDDGMLWMYVHKLQELMHPTVKCIFLFEFDKAN